MRVLGVYTTLMMRSFAVAMPEVGVLTRPGQPIWFPPTARHTLFDLTLFGRSDATKRDYVAFRPLGNL
jgi:hypothetical protein